MKKIILTKNEKIKGELLRRIDEIDPDSILSGTQEVKYLYVIVRLLKIIASCLVKKM